MASMDSSDVVEPRDAAVNELLGQIADRTRDPERRERILGLMLTLPPLAEWPAEALEQWRATYDYIRSLRRDLEQLSSRRCTTTPRMMKAASGRAASQPE
jgi:hypothetical protein